MIKLLTILLFISFHANGTNYYFKQSGSDGNAGTIGSPWKTIAKFNATTFAGGDSAKFNGGDAWNEKMVISNSGSIGNPIVICSYGTGKAIFTGFQTLTSWANEGGNIWSKVFTNSVSYQNTVYINEALRAKGRYPNTGWLTFTSHSGNTQITGGLTGTPNCTGGEVVIRNNNFTIDKGYITSQSTGEINYSPATYYTPTNGYGYFIQNIPSVLDTLNEWCIDTTTKKISVYETSEPTGKASSIDTLVKIIKKDYITFDGLQFDGANLTAFQVDSSSNITITNCDILNSGANGVTGKASNYLTFSSNTIRNTWNNGLILLDFTLTNSADSDDGLITGNIVANTGTAAGMGKTGFQSYTAIEPFGDRTVISYNHITNTGYIGIYFSGDTNLVHHNYIDSFCNVKDDGGGIYTWNGYHVNTGGYVDSNIVLNGFNATAGTAVLFGSSGIYMDAEVEHINILGNTVAHVVTNGILLNTAYFITMRDNNITSDVGTCLALTSGNAVGAGHIFKNNKNYINILLYVSTVGFTSASRIGSSDSNYYANPADINGIVSTNVKNSLATWQAASGMDAHSVGVPPTGTTVADPILKYNATTSPVSYPLTGTYKDWEGNNYINTVLVQPYQSKLLFKATVDLLTGNVRKIGSLNFQ